MRALETAQDGQILDIEGVLREMPLRVRLRLIASTALLKEVLEKDVIEHLTALSGFYLFVTFHPCSCPYLKSKKVY